WRRGLQSSPRSAPRRSRRLHVKVILMPGSSPKSARPRRRAIPSPLTRAPRPAVTPAPTPLKVDEPAPVKADVPDEASEPRPSRAVRRDPILLEIAWEVCNQLGGIYTVLRSKVPAM